MKIFHSRPAGSFDRMNRIDRILNETASVGILFILFILSWTLNATSRNAVRFPRKLGSFFPSFFRYGMAVKIFDESSVQI